MADPRRDETIDLWVDDFCESAWFADRETPRNEYAPEILFRFLDAACGVRDVTPDEIEEGDLKPALVEGVAKLNLPASVRQVVPALCADFLEELESVGRLSGGRILAGYVRALAMPYLDAASGKPRPFVSPSSKIGRNAPCPCGSGRKYKRCCGRG